MCRVSPDHTLSCLKQAAVLVSRSICQIEQGNLNHARTRKKSLLVREKTSANGESGNTVKQRKGIFGNRCGKWVCCMLSSHLFRTPVYIVGSMWAHQPGSRRSGVNTGVSICIASLIPHLHYAVPAFNFIARRVQRFISVIDRELELCVPMTLSFSIIRHDVRKNQNV